MRTPLVRLDRLSDQLGVDVWLKRDDVAPFGIAGAKGRKLGVIVARARETGADTLVTIGPAQSNTCRALAAACAMTGLKAHLVIASHPPAQLSGNLLLARMMGATIEFAGDVPMRDLGGALDSSIERLRAHGARPLRLEPGCSSPDGVIGMLLGYLDFVVQCGETELAPSAIRHGSATGGLWAGLALGAALTGGPAPLASLVLDDLYPDTLAGYMALAQASLARLGDPTLVAPLAAALDRRRLEDPYGTLSAERVRVLATFARSDAVILDPVYAGAAAQSLLADARAGVLKGPVVLWHSGGVQALGDAALAAEIGRLLPD